MSRLRRSRPGLRVGLISDIHAHIDQLDRALAILSNAGADEVVCLGDVVEKGSEPDRVVERLDALYIPTVKGNHDANAVRHAELEPRDCGMTRDTIAWLDALPSTREYEWAGLRVALAHASLADDRSGVHPDQIPKSMRRCLRRSDPDVVLLGHTHIPMRFRWAHHWLCNPGSVSSGRSRHGPTCAVLTLPEVTLELYSVVTGVLVA
jgi:putative phosphoesterase